MNKVKPEKEDRKKAPDAKSITPDDRKRMTVEGIKKTVVPAFIGTAFAILFFLRFGDANEVSWFTVILLIALVSYYIQRLLYPSLGIKVKEFETKDWLYVEFLIIIFLLVVWTLLLN